MLETVLHENSALKIVNLYSLNVIYISDFTELIKRKLIDKNIISNEEILSDFEVYCKFITVKTLDVC